MQHSESPIIHFLRSVTLLGTLVCVPSIAIIWNHFPIDFFGGSDTKSIASVSETTQHNSTDAVTETSLSIFALESTTPPLPEVQMQPTFSMPESKMASVSSIQQMAWDTTRAAAVPQNFETLELHLKALGATYYRLEKWGNRGELFRFSCFVTPPEPQSYEKHFQAIGTDAVTVMRSVITEIETWKRGM